MTDDLSYIEDYFNGLLTTEEQQAFEKRLVEDTQLAEQVGFYLSTIHSIREPFVQQRKQHFRNLYQPAAPVVSIRKYWIYASSAAAVLVVAALLFFRSSSPVSLADDFIQKNIRELSVKMGAGDSLERAKELYNLNKLQESLVIFRALSRDSLPTDALKFSGFVYLRQQNYDKAVSCFQKMESSQLQNNPGAFYHALTLMKRNEKGDKEAAKTLLKTVVDNQLAYAEVAAGWLQKMK